MKKLFLLIFLLSTCYFLPSEANAQARYKEILDSVRSGSDSVKTFSLGTAYDEGFVSMSDSSNSTGDSLKAYAETSVGSGVWAPYGLKNAKTGTVEFIFAPGDGLAAIWYFDGPIPPSLRFAITNAQYSALRKTKIGFLLKRTPRL